jgi:signal transduction histidine kinase
MFIVSGMIILRFIRATDQVEALNVTLEQRIEKKGSDLEENYLRLMIDSFEPSDNDLGTVLGIFRSRLSPILQHQKVDLRWQVQDVPPIPHLGPQKVLHLLRILQEATTNVLKHTEASTLTFTTGETALPTDVTGVYLEVADNSKGFGPDQGNGQGLRNMLRRAQAIDAELSFEDAHPGTLLRLTIPVFAEES